MNRKTHASDNIRHLTFCAIPSRSPSLNLPQPRRLSSFCDFILMNCFIVYLSTGWIWYWRYHFEVLSLKLLSLSYSVLFGLLLHSIYSDLTILSNCIFCCQFFCCYILRIYIFKQNGKLIKYKNHIKTPECTQKEWTVKRKCA